MFCMVDPCRDRGLAVQIAGLVQKLAGVAQCIDLSRGLNK